MAKVIVVVNQKGGVGKTGTSINLAGGLAILGKKVLAIDWDIQGHLTIYGGYNKNELPLTIYDCLTGNANIKDVIIYNKERNYYILPTNIKQGLLERDYMEMDEGELQLKYLLEPIKDEYDYIIIDSPPNLGIFTKNGLCAADEVLIPIQAESSSLDGVDQLMLTIQYIKENLNPNLEINGVLVTMYDARTKESSDVHETVKDFFGNKVYLTVINRNTHISGSFTNYMDIYRHKPRCTGALDYMKFSTEFMGRQNGKEDNK